MRKTARQNEVNSRVFSYHGPDAGTMKWSHLEDTERETLRKSMIADSREAAKRVPGFDMTSLKKPMAKFRKLDFM